MGERVSYKANGGTTQAYLAKPAADGPGIVVIQEYWGLVPHIERIADRFAEAGFVALAPDLYHGEQAKSPDEAGKLMMSMRIDQAARDLAGAIDYLATLPQTKPKRVATIGFCMGGALSLYAASVNPEVGACVVFYGGHPKAETNHPAPHAPLPRPYSGQGGLCTPSRVEGPARQRTS